MRGPGSPSRAPPAPALGGGSAPSPTDCTSRLREATAITGSPEDFLTSGPGREWQPHLPFLPSPVINALGRLPTRPGARALGGPQVPERGVGAAPVAPGGPAPVQPRPGRVSSSTALRTGCEVTAGACTGQDAATRASVE